MPAEPSSRKMARPSKLRMQGRCCRVQPPCAIARRSAPRLHAARRRSHARQHSRPAEVRRSLTCSCAAMAASATRNTAETPSRQRKRPASLVRLSLSSLIRQSRAVSVWRAAVLSTLSHHRCQHRPARAHAHRSALGDPRALLGAGVQSAHRIVDRKAKPGATAVDAAWQ